MAKREEKKLCWSCDGYVPTECESCPYCATDLRTPPAPTTAPDLTPPYRGQEYTVTQEEWDAVDKKKEEEGETQNELVALLLLIPGVALVLFALLILFFSQEGVLHLHWKENIAYFYLVGALPLLFLGWRALSRR